MAGIIIVGAGQAAVQAAASLRQEGCKDEITIFGDEPWLPYQRPLLSKQYLLGTETEEQIYQRAEKFYEDQRVVLRLGERIESIDVAAKTVTSAKGEVIPYKELLLATGSRPRILKIQGSELSGIHYLRTLGDVNAIKNEMAPGKRLVIIGGGYIGLEVASVAVTLGLDVTVLEMEERILKRVTTAEMSEFYHQLHAGRGVKILLRTAVSGFEGDGHITHVLCGDQRIAADMVIVGIGIIPNVELAQAAGIECNNGIVVDDRCRTSAEHVYALGDCSNHPSPLVGRRLRLESVPNAQDQAKVVAANIMGKAKIYSAVPWFWSDQYELKLQMVGFSADGDTQVLRGDKSTNQFTVFYLKEGKLVAVDAVNNPRDFMIGRQFYGRKMDVSRLSDLSVDVKDLVLPVSVG